mmetsp:Transcript_8783/g.27673  ORF Transcript_8783/g.27673 Transcript_8783/m.27673 type:complete len:204 (+) Transcript_8783:306-917(+)
MLRDDADGDNTRDADFGPREEEIREQDRFLPVANIARIMKRVLPPNEKIAKDAKEALQECVSEFICFVTSEASDRCQTEKRKTINGDDLVWAMGTLGFDDYVGPLKLFLTKYRQASKGEKNERYGQRTTRIPDFVDDAVLEQAEGFRDSFYTDVRSRSPPRNRAENSNPNDIAITPNDTAVRVAIPDAVLERYRHGNDKVHMS